MSQPAPSGAATGTVESTGVVAVGSPLAFRFRP